MKALQCFKALADETRLRLFSVLLRHELNVNELVAVMDMGQPRVSRHLKILAESGLITVRRDGLWAFYSATEHSEELSALATATSALLVDEPFAADHARAARVVRERSQATKQFFNEIAHDWQRLSQELLGDLNLAAVIADRIGDCGTVADLGCGTGEVMQALLTRADKAIGVDGSAEMLERAALRFETNGNAVSLRIGELEHLPLRDGEADCAVMSMVLHHLPDPRAGLAEAFRILRPGGAMVIAEFEKHTDENMRQNHGDRWLGFDSQELRSWLTTVGFIADEPERYELKEGLGLHLYTAKKL